ncbi:hypothetical protein [Acetobacter sp. UBA5411]|uniref:hypothetical protein n=1 Tax=Acetobacter sp. UBA5411 TaxID=1945905 RepID=UPI0025BE2547|nr:hypothetical protein [Acetobacter sp. UBA5411]
MKWLNKRKPCKLRVVMGFPYGEMWDYDFTHSVDHKVWHDRSFWSLDDARNRLGLPL